MATNASDVPRKAIEEGVLRLGVARLASRCRNRAVRVRRAGAQVRPGWIEFEARCGARCIRRRERRVIAHSEPPVDQRIAFNIGQTIGQRRCGS